MEQLTRPLAKITKHLLKGLLLSIAIGFFYRIFQIYQLEQAGINSGWTYLVLFFLIAVEVYVVALYFWLRYLSSTNKEGIFTFVQLVIIFVFGIIPGIIALYPAFFKE